MKFVVLLQACCTLMFVVTDAGHAQGFRGDSTQARLLSSYDEAQLATDSLPIVWETQDSTTYSFYGGRSFLLLPDSSMVLTSPGFRTKGYPAGRTILRISKSGSRMWAVEFGEETATSHPGVEVRSIREHAGKLYATGWSMVGSGIATDTSTLRGILDAFVLCFDLETGQRLWGRFIGGDRDDGGRDLAFDAAGNIYIAGVTGSDNGIATDTSRMNTSFVMKLDSTGRTIWGTYITPSGYTGEIRAIRSLADGTLVVCGIHYSTGFSFTIPTTAMGSGFLIALSPDDGSVRWSTSYGDEYRDVDIAPNQNIIVAGQTRRLTPFSTDGTWNHGFYEFSLSSFSPQGVMQWTTLLGGSFDENLGSIEIANNGEIYLVGSIGSNDIKSILPRTTKPGYTGYVAVFTPQGHVRWASYLPFSEAMAIQIDPDGNAVIPGLLQHLRILALDVTYGILGVETPMQPQSSAIILATPYPQPAAAVCTLPMELRSAQSVSIRIVDLLGRTVFVQARREFPMGRHNISLPVNGLPRGTYRVFVQGGGCVAQTLIVVL